jgi:hypothetical protein
MLLAAARCMKKLCLDLTALATVLAASGGCQDISEHDIEPTRLQTEVSAITLTAKTPAAALPGASDTGTPSPDQNDLDGDGVRWSSIQRVKRGELVVGSKVAVRDLVVTARYASGFFAQQFQLSDAYQGHEYSGVFVFAPGNSLAVGDLIEIPAATLLSFLGQLILSDVQGINSTGHGVAVAPVVVSVAELDNLNERATALDGVLVQFQMIASTGPQNVSNEFPIGKTVRVDDLLYDYGRVQSGQFFQVLTGIVQSRVDATRIEPRGQSETLF